MVAESGFGTGLNFLTLWQAFDQFRERIRKRNYNAYISLVLRNFPSPCGFSLSVHRPELAPWAEQLQAQWPMPLPGCHRLLLDEGRVTLDLWFGDINELTSQLDDSLNQEMPGFWTALRQRKTRICGRKSV